MSDWHKLAATADIPNGTGKEFTVAGRIVALFNLDGKFHALDGLCAHQGGPIAQGTVTRCIVTCPWHGWQYNIATGHHCLNGRITQEKFTTKIEDDTVWVQLGN